MDVPYVDAETRIKIEWDEATLIFDSTFLWVVGAPFEDALSSPQEENLWLWGVHENRSLWQPTEEMHGT